MKKIRYTILYCVCENFSESILLRCRFWFRFRNRNVTVTGTVTYYGPVPLRQKVTIPPVPVPQRCQNFPDILLYVARYFFHPSDKTLFSCSHVVRMARYICHLSDWGAMATINSRSPLASFPFANVFSISDGPLDNSTGRKQVIRILCLNF
jgi:hypothetical protein